MSDAQLDLLISFIVKVLFLIMAGAVIYEIIIRLVHIQSKLNHLEKLIKEMKK